MSMIFIQDNLTNVWEPVLDYCIYTSAYCINMDNLTNMLCHEELGPVRYMWKLLYEAGDTREQE